MDDENYDKIEDSFCQRCGNIMRPIGDGKFSCQNCPEDLQDFPSRILMPQAIDNILDIERHRP